MMKICSTEFVYHVSLNPEMENRTRIIEEGLRPLSDFPDSDRWKQLEEQMPDFYKNLYEMLAKPILKRDYENSGIFVSPIDFQKLPKSFMYNKDRFELPVERLDPEYCVLTWVIDEERISLPLTAANLEMCAEIWTTDMVEKWFAKDNTKIFFYVPQIAVYQPGGIKVFPGDFQHFES